jgi:hypothetical protein
MNILYKMFKLHTFILNLIYIYIYMLRETGYIKLSGFIAGLFMALKKGPP